MRKKEEIERRFDEICGHGSSQEIENATTVEKSSSGLKRHQNERKGWSYARR